MVLGNTLDLKIIYLYANKDTLAEYSDFTKDLESKYTVKINEELSSIEKNYIILVIGGDGTLNYFLNHIYNNLSGENIDLFYYPSGTANDFARSLKSSDYQLTLAMFESVVRAKNKLMVPVMQCNDRYFINVASAGAPALVTESGSDLVKKVTGKISYYLNGLEKLLKPKQQTYTVSTKQTESFEISTYGFFVSQGLYAGGGVRTSTSYSASFGNQFEFLSTKSQDISQVVKDAVALQACSFTLLSEDIISLYTDNLTVVSSSEIEVKLDGEYYSADKLEFSKTEQSIKFFNY